MLTATNMRQTLFILTVTIYLTSGCTDSLEKERNAAGLVAKQVNAGKAEIAFKEYTDTDHRNRKNIILTLENLKDIPKNFSKEKITSTAALLYLKQFDKSTYKDYDDITVNLEGT